MKKDMSLEGLRWSCDSGSALYDTPPNGRSRTGWGGRFYGCLYAIFYRISTKMNSTGHHVPNGWGTNAQRVGIRCPRLGLIRIR